MANTGFSLNNVACLDPKPMYDHCVAETFPTGWYGKANRYSCPMIGQEPGHGHVLLKLSDYYSLKKTASVYTLRMMSQYYSQSFTGIMFSGFPQIITPGASDPAVLVEITDTRSNSAKATNDRYTWRSSPSQTTPINAKTWEEVCEDLWNKNQFPQAWPGLPSSVRGTTISCEQFDCMGFKVSSCLDDILQALGCVVVYDPINDSCSIEYIADTSDFIKVFATAYRNDLIHDGVPYSQENPIQYMPAQARVMFPVWSESSGTDSRSVYTKDVTAPSGLAASIQIGTVILQDKQPLRIDSSGSMLNQATIDQRAEAVAGTYFDRFKSGNIVQPVIRAYKGFVKPDGGLNISGSQWDYISWHDIGNGPCTVFVRQGMAATGELYDSSLIGSPGLLTGTFNPIALYQNGSIVRAGVIQPALARDKQNSGWWDDPTNEVIRLVGTSIGPYMMRTQSLRYGEYAQVSTGGRGDLRGRLYRTWNEPGTSSESAGSTLKFFWVYAPVNTAPNIYIGYPQTSDNINPKFWSYGQAEFLVSANAETLTVGSRYLSRKTDIHGGFDGTYTDGYWGTRRLWAADCCGNDGEGGPPLPGPATPIDQQDLVGAGCETCPIIPKYINILVQPGTYGALSATFTEFYIQGEWNGSYYTVPGTYSPALDFYISGGISCILRGPGYFLPACFPGTPDFSNYFTFNGAVSGTSLPFSIVFDAGCTYYNQETPFSSVVCSPFSFVINLYFGLIKLTVSKA